jgi:hypothetical protein
MKMYRPGSVTRPTCGQVILLTANHFPFAPRLLIVIPNLAAFLRIKPGECRSRSARRSRGCVFARAISSRSVAIDHPRPDPVSL